METPLVLQGNVQEIIGKPELEKMLASGRSLNVKLGLDPTTTDLHLGHAVVLRKLKEFQDLGHHIYLVIGDFTAGIGDSAGVVKTRPVLSEAEIRHNLETYTDQASKILDIEKTHIVFNSEWLKTMSLGQFISYAMQVSVNTLVEREDFGKRLQANQSVGLHEFIYPVVQAIDSVFLKADVELGGMDQLLNLLMGRELQKKLGQPPQALVLMKELIGTDGELKMSKSKGNYIAITEAPAQMFGKLMRIPDNLIDDYGHSHDLDMRSAPDSPRDRKAYVAEGIVAIYHGEKDAEKAMDDFDATFKRKIIAEELVTHLKLIDRDLPLIQIVAQATTSSSSEARRLIEQRAVKVGNEVATDPLRKVHIGKDPVRLQVGKHRFFALEYKDED